MNAVKPHPFEPDVAGKTCATMLYPEYKRCGKSPRAKVHTGTRPDPPELEFPYPPCSLCGKDTYHDGDSFVCDPCGAYWSSNTGRGSWMEPDLKVCASTHTPFDRPDLGAEHESIRHHVAHCMREDGHDGKHRSDEFTEWDGAR